PREFPALISISGQLIRSVGQGLQRVSSQVFQLKGKSAELSQTLHRGRIERDHQAAGNRRQLRPHLLDNGRPAMSAAFAVLEVCQIEENHRPIRSVSGEAEPYDRERAGDLRNMRDGL